MTSKEILEELLEEFNKQLAMSHAKAKEANHLSDFYSGQIYAFGFAVGYVGASLRSEVEE
jgi:hypothetical protein